MASEQASDDEPSEPLLDRALVDGELDESADLFDFDLFLAAKEQASSAIDLDELLAALGDDPKPAGGERPSDPVVEPESALPPASAGASQAGARAAERVLEQVVMVPERRAPFAGMTSVVIIAMGALTLVNVGVVGFSWMARTGMQSSLDEMGRQVVATTEQIRKESAMQVRTVEALSAPVAAIDPEKVKTLERVAAELEAGEYEVARKRVYSLLAVADRLDARVREDVEARASFLLADALRLEALARLGPADGGAR